MRRARAGQKRRSGCWMPRRWTPVHALCSPPVRMLKPCDHVRTNVLDSIMRSGSVQVLLSNDYLSMTKPYLSSPGLNISGEIAAWVCLGGCLERSTHAGVTWGCLKVADPEPNQIHADGVVHVWRGADAHRAAREDVEGLCCAHDALAALLAALDLPLSTPICLVTQVSKTRKAYNDSLVGPKVSSTPSPSPHRGAGCNRLQVISDRAQGF